METTVKNYQLLCVQPPTSSYNFQPLMFAMVIMVATVMVVMVVMVVVVVVVLIIIRSNHH